MAENAVQFARQLQQQNHLAARNLKRGSTSTQQYHRELLKDIMNVAPPERIQTSGYKTITTSKASDTNMPKLQYPSSSRDVLIIESSEDEVESGDSEQENGELLRFRRLKKSGDYATLGGLKMTQEWYRQLSRRQQDAVLDLWIQFYQNSNIRQDAKPRSDLTPCSVDGRMQLVAFLESFAYSFPKKVRAVLLVVPDPDKSSSGVMEEYLSLLQSSSSNLMLRVMQGSKQHIEKVRNEIAKLSNCGVVVCTENDFLCESKFLADNRRDWDLIVYDQMMPSTRTRQVQKSLNNFRSSAYIVISSKRESSNIASHSTNRLSSNITSDSSSLITSRPIEAKADASSQWSSGSRDDQDYFKMNEISLGLPHVGDYRNDPFHLKKPESKRASRRKSVRRKDSTRPSMGRCSEEGYETANGEPEDEELEETDTDGNMVEPNVDSEPQLVDILAPDDVEILSQPRDSCGSIPEDPIPPVTKGRRKLSVSSSESGPESQHISTPRRKRTPHLDSPAERKSRTTPARRSRGITPSKTPQHKRQPRLTGFRFAQQSADRCKIAGADRDKYISAVSQADFLWSSQSCPERPEYQVMIEALKLYLHALRNICDRDPMLHLRILGLASEMSLLNESDLMR